MTWLRFWLLPGCRYFDHTNNNLLVQCLESINLVIYKYSLTFLSIEWMTLKFVILPKVHHITCNKTCLQGYFCIPSSFELILIISTKSRLLLVGNILEERKFKIKKGIINSQYIVFEVYIMFVLWENWKMHLRKKS